MNLDKKTINKIILLIIFASIAFWCGQYFFDIVKYLLYILSVFTPLILGFAIAFVLNVFMKGIEQKWDKHIKEGKISNILKRPISLILTLLIVCAFIFVLLFMIVPEISRTISGIAESFPGYMDTLQQNVDKILSDLNIPFADIKNLNVDWDKLGESASKMLSTGGSSIFNTTFSFATSVFSGALNLVLGIVFAIYMLLQKETLINQFNNVMKAYLNKDIVERTRYIGQVSNRIFSKFVTGQLLEAFIIGVLCFIGMSILQMPYAVMISTLVGFTALIPVVGAFIGTAVGAFLILLISPIKAFWFIVFIIVLQQFEGNLIYPKVVGKSVGLPGIWVLAAVTFGGSLAGLLGMLIAVPVCSVVYTLLKENVRYRLKKKEII